MPGHTPYTRPCTLHSTVPYNRHGQCLLCGTKNNVRLTLTSTAVPWLSRRPLTAEARVRCRFSPCAIRGGQWQWGRYILGSLVGPVTIIPPMPHNQLHLHAALTNKVKREKHADFPKDNTPT